MKHSLLEELSQRGWLVSFAEYREDSRLVQDDFYHSSHDNVFGLHKGEGFLGRLIKFTRGQAQDALSTMTSMKCMVFLFSVSPVLDVAGSNAFQQHGEQPVHQDPAQARGN